MFLVLTLLPDKYLANSSTTYEALTNAINELHDAIAKHSISDDDVTLAVEYLVNSYLSD